MYACIYAIRLVPLKHTLSIDDVVFIAPLKHTLSIDDVVFIAAGSAWIQKPTLC